MPYCEDENFDTHLPPRVIIPDSMHECYVVYQGSLHLPLHNVTPQPVVLLQILTSTGSLTYYWQGMRLWMIRIAVSLSDIIRLSVRIQQS